MDFTKFIALLESRSLYFCRADLLGDPFEGSVLLPNQQDEQRALAKQKDPTQVQDVGYSRTFRYGTYINCWHLSDHESAAMWKLYATTNEVIAIRTTYYNLFNVLPDHTFLGLIEYIDYQRDKIDLGNLYTPFLHKRKSFSHEVEVRAMISRFPPNCKISDLTKNSTEPGIAVPVDLDRLHLEVFVAPTCPPWVRELTRKICNRYGLLVPVKQSQIDGEPIF